MEKIQIGLTFKGSDSFEHAILKIHNPQQFEDCVIERRSDQILLGMGSTGTSNLDTIIEFTGLLSIQELLNAAANAGWIRNDEDLTNFRNYLEGKI